MDTRMKQIMDNYKNNKLTADSPFQFHCTQCEKCCIDREDILLSALDLFRIAKELNLSLEEVLNQYCEWYIGPDSRFPLVRLKPRGSVRRCPLLKNRRCLVHKAKPAVCAMFPIGRAIRFSDTEAETSEKPVIEYFYNDPGCGDNVKTQTVREWFNHFRIPLEDEFFIEWTLFQKNLHDLLAEAERKFGEAAMQHIWSPVFGVLYLCYNPKEEFLPQFRANAEKLLNGLQMILGHL